MCNSVRDALALAAHDDKKVHAVNANAGIILNAQVNVLINTKAKVADVGEVLAVQLKLLHLCYSKAEKRRKKELKNK